MGHPQGEREGIAFQGILILPQFQRNEVLPLLQQRKLRSPGKPVAAHLTALSADVHPAVLQRPHNGKQDRVLSRPKGRVSSPDILQAVCVPQGYQLPALCPGCGLQPPLFQLICHRSASSLKCYLQNQRHTTQNDGTGDIQIPSQAVPHPARRPLRAPVDLLHQLVPLHNPEPGQRPQGGSNGDDIDGHDVHPGPPLENGFHVQADSQADHTQQGQHSFPIQLGKTVEEGFSHRLKHILEGTDPSEYHGCV